MLIATIAALMLLFGGGSLNFYLTNLKGPVKEHVQDKDRREVILDASKALSKDLKVLEKQIEEHFEELVEVHNDYDSKESNFDAATTKLLGDQHDLSTWVLDARDVMHEQMTKEEWEAVFKPKN